MRRYGHLFPGIDEQIQFRRCVQLRIHRETGTEYNNEGWNYYGLNEKTKTYYDVNGYTREGLDKYGFKKGQRPANFNVGEYDKDGFNKDGVYIKGY